MIMTRQEVRDFDNWAINVLGVPGVVLMENAGRNCAEFIAEKLTHKSDPVVAVFCGTGNNGGDGYVIARHLLNSGFRVTTALCGDREKVKGDAKVNLKILDSIHAAPHQLDMRRDSLQRQIEKLTRNADMIVDAIFGTGLQGRVRSPYDTIIAAINAHKSLRFAVDIPSGLDCNTADVLGEAVKADYTVTFAAMKKGFVVSQTAHDYTGRIYVAGIGVEPAENSSFNCTMHKQ